MLTHSYDRAPLHEKRGVASTPAASADTDYRYRQSSNLDEPELILPYAFYGGEEVLLRLSEPYRYTAILIRRR